MANNYTKRQQVDYNFDPNNYESYKSVAEKASAADTKYNSIGEYINPNADMFSTAKDAYLNRKAFSYDLNGDALYQQYKDNYIQQGKMAMQDAMGQAAAMTGGYGNSYAATVGNQAYQGYLQGLNDKVPELYQLAMQRYNMEGDRLRDVYGVLRDEDETGYNRHMDTKNTAFKEMEYTNALKDTAYTQVQNDYNNYVTANNNSYWAENEFGYKQEQDSIANQLARDQYNLSERSVNAQEEANRLAKQQAENEVDYSQITKFQNALVDEDKLEKITVGSRGNTGNGGYRYGGKRYATYQDYVKAQLNDHYSKFGTINAGTLAYLLDFYGIE